MKKQIATVFATLITIMSFAQQFTFQGKLYQNNQPISGIGNFQFFINSGGVNWSETHTGIPVNNGLYAVVLGSISALPLDLFKVSQSLPMEVRYNNTLIDNVTLYAPFERDYTVPNYIKDGISWSEVTNKPTLDTSFTNEIQTLTLNGNTLSISQGNSVVLPSGGGSGNTVIGNFTVFDTTSTVMPNVGQTGNCSQDAFSTTIWQSFLCTSSGKLRAIRVQVGSISATSALVNIYSGVGNQGQSLGSALSFPISGALSYRFLDLSSLNIPLSSGNIYTFSIAPNPNGSQLVVGRNFLTADPYTNGVSSYGTTADLCFEIYTDHTNPPSLTVQNNGYVGISNNNPTSQLSVNGRIEDVTGFVTPVGSITAYGGATVPKGWLICDGSSVSRTQYADLFNAIGSGWGKQDSVSFNLPDLRGNFLRGVDGLAGKDSDKNSRTAANVGGNTGNNVGSVQNDDIKSHSHTLVNASALIYGLGISNFSSGNSGSGTYGAGNNPPSIANTGGAETRPKNAYVYYIIKY